MTDQKISNDTNAEPVPFMNPLTTSVNKMVKDGYTDNFKVTNQGLHDTSNDKIYQPDEITITDFHRFEGQSDPGDNAILYAIETKDGAKGLIIDAYGTYSDVQVSKFMQEVEDINKKVTKSE